MEEKFSVRLKAARDKIGFTNKELSDFLGIKERTVQGWLWNERTPKDYAQSAILDKLKDRD